MTEIFGLVEGVRVRMGSEDWWVWVPDSSGQFSVKSAWDVLRPRRPKVWGNIPRHSCCAWLAVRDRFGMRDCLSR